MELLLKVGAIVVVVGIAAYVLYNHWQERRGENHFQSHFLLDKG